MLKGCLPTFFLIYNFNVFSLQKISILVNRSLFVSNRKALLFSPLLC